jgi:hypothetical protein
MATVQHFYVVSFLIAIIDETLKIKIRNFKWNLLLNVTNCQHADCVILEIRGLPEN